MTGHIEDQALELITRGCIDDTAQYLLRLWIRSQGKIEDPNLFQGVAPHFVRLSGNVPVNDSPEILFVGRKSLMGREIAAAPKSRTDRRQFFKSDFRQAVRDAFARALDEPVLQIVQDEFAADRGMCILTYERINLSWRTTDGTPYLFSYSKLIHKSHGDRLPNPEDWLGYSPLQRGDHQWMMADLPSEGRDSGTLRNHKPSDSASPNLPA